MKSLLRLVLMGTLISGALAARGSDYRYALILRGTCKSVDESGEIVTTRHTTATILAQCAAQQEPPRDPRELALVYDVSAGASYVVDKSTGEEVCDYLKLETRSALGNASGTKWEILVDLDDPSTEGDEGGGLMTFSLNFNNQGKVSKFRISGRYHLIYGDDDSGQTIVCSGRIVTGRKFTSPKAPR